MRRVALSTSLLLLLTAQAGVPRAADERFVPDPEAAQSMTLEGRTWSSVTPGVAMRLQRLTDDERVAYIEHVTGRRIDPFRSPGEEGSFETFLVEVENLGDGGLSFNPHDCWLSAGQREVLFPLGIEDLGTLYRQMDGDLPEAYNVARPALLDQRTMVPRNGSVAGLLVYRGLETRAKRFRVDVKLTLGNGDVLRANAAYRRGSKK